jgi:rhodanese-related sulfurtransferase
MDYEISVDQLKALLASDDPPILLDVREQWEFDTAHIANAILMPMGDVPSRAHQELDEEEHVVVLCHHGARSLSVTAWLRNQGYDKAQSVAGGIDAWSRAIDPTVPLY